MITLLTESLSGSQPDTMLIATTAMFDETSLPLYLQQIPQASVCVCVWTKLAGNYAMK